MDCKGVLGNWEVTYMDCKGVRGIGRYTYMDCKGVLYTIHGL